MIDRRSGKTRIGALAIPSDITAIVKRVVAAVQPTQAILFGSYARGDAHRWSDVDLLVVIPNGREERQAWKAAREAVRGASLPCDVIVATEDQIRRLGNLVGMVFRPALRDGWLLYDVAAHPRWDKSGRRLEVDPVTEEMRLSATRRWLRQARSDLIGAETLLKSADIDPDPARYLAQQGAEKALKAVLVSSRPTTHSPMTSTPFESESPPVGG